MRSYSMSRAVSVLISESLQRGGGSLGRGDADALSDIDVALAVWTSTVLT